ncbi:MAG: hypothetical protein Q7S57_01540 [bacterium]|nr:hypothetical protein [bacterium]
MEKGQHFALLAVEDNTLHLRDLMQVIGELPDDFPLDLEIKCVRSLREALNNLESADGVITDVFFPEIPDGDATQPNGKKVVEACIAAQKPVVWITSTYHHGTMTNAVSEWGRDRGLEMFDCPNAGRGSEEAPHKPWKEALYGLIYTAVEIEMKLLQFKDGQIQRRVNYNKDFSLAAGIYRELMLLYLSAENIKPYPVMKKMLDMGFPRK